LGRLSQIANAPRRRWFADELVEIDIDHFHALDEERLPQLLSDSADGGNEEGAVKKPQNSTP
jgi:hypothetical protein